MSKKTTSENAVPSVDSNREQREKAEKTRATVIEILQKVGMAEAQANLIFPQSMYFISIVELHNLLSQIREKKISWLLFLESIPTETIKNDALYKAYINAHKHYGLSTKAPSDNEKMSLPSVSKTIKLLYRIFYFMDYMTKEQFCVKLPGEPILTPQLVTQIGLQMDKFSVYSEYQDLFAKLERLIGIQRDFIFSPEMKRAGKLVKKIYSIEPGHPGFFKGDKHALRNEKFEEKYTAYYRDVFFKDKFTDTHFVSELAAYFADAFPEGEMHQLLFPFTYENVLKTNLLDSEDSLPHLIKKIEQNKLFTLLLAEGLDVTAVRLLMNLLYFEPGFHAKNYVVEKSE